MSWSDVIYKFAPFREDVVQDMVRVVHDAIDRVIWVLSISAMKTKCLSSSVKEVHFTLCSSYQPTRLSPSASMCVCPSDRLSLSLSLSLFNMFSHKQRKNVHELLKSVVSANRNQFSLPLWRPLLL